MKKYYGLLVGMHFRPPAKWILARLPARTALIVEPEPENPHDPQALRVSVATTSLPEATWNDSSFAEELVGCGLTPEELRAVEVIWLGYLARQENKQLVKLNEQGASLIGAAQVGDLIKDPSHRVTLVFGLSGEPQVLIETTP